MNAEIDLAIASLASDNESGAAEILTRASAVFSILEAHTQAVPSDFDSLLASVIEISAAIVRAQAEMAPMINLASAAIAQASVAQSATEVAAAAHSGAARFAQLAREATALAATEAARGIPNGAALLTHSRSSTIVSAMLIAHRSGKRFSVVATEARPMLEGRALCEQLAREGIRVSLIADSSVARVLDGVDQILLGADRVTPLNLVNKIGTRMIALAARERGLPVRAVCDTSKFIDIESAAESKMLRPAEELWPEAHQDIAVLNFYFEPTPLALFDGIITEFGKLDSKEAAALAQKTKPHQRLIDALSHS